MTSHEPFVGIWRGSAFPTQETILVFCPDGKGFLFFYWGSLGSPFVDEFNWSAGGEGEVFLAWTVRHEPDYEGGADLRVASGLSEAVPFQLGAGSERTLEVELGMHTGFDTPLEHVGEPAESSRERERLHRLAEVFDPSGPGRQVWMFDERGQWQRTPFTVIGDISPERSPLGSWGLLGLILGTFGQTYFLAVATRGVVAVWLGVGFLMLPLAGLILFQGEERRAGRWGQFSDRLQWAAALCFLLTSGLAGVLVVLGYRPDGWPIALVSILAGAAVSSWRLLRKKP